MIAIVLIAIKDMGPEDPSNRKKIPIIFLKAKSSEIAEHFQKCKSQNREWRALKVIPNFQKCPL